MALLSLGCKVNSYETDSIRRQFEEAGAVIVDFDGACRGADGGADIFVINTCSVTNIADRKSRQMLRRARQNNPGAIVAATGCYAQIGAQELIDSGCADIVAGNSHKSELIDMIAARMADPMRQDMSEDDPTDVRTGPVSEITPVNVSSMKDEHCYEDMRIDSCDERVRAFVKVEDGCDQFCTYCIIPYARGRVRSRSKEDVLGEIRGLAAKGFKEVVITGIHVSSYGCASYEKAGEFRHGPLLELIRETAKI
ncbi:MAG: radical SAM protein, partial [Lachnospiraceae bacterium]|nr:radical SAM protein [Lachnospiraceae bacterium]